MKSTACLRAGPGTSLVAAASTTAAASSSGALRCSLPAVRYWARAAAASSSSAACRALTWRWARQLPATREQVAKSSAGADAPWPAGVASARMSCRRAATGFHAVLAEAAAAS